MDNLHKLIQHPLFSKLKDIIENNPYHDHESVYDHLIKTKDIAVGEISGQFIANPEAHKLFLQYIGRELDGIKRADLMMIAALLHDVGKLENPLLKDDQGITSMPGHEQKGYEVAQKILKGFSLTPKQIEYISKIVGSHGVFQYDYLPSKKAWSVQDIVEDMKSKADGLYIESMFNNYCDVYSAPPFQPFKNLVIKIFNEPKLYV